MSVKPVSIAFLVVICALATANASSCGWRNNGTGQFPDAEPPVEWSVSKNVKWSVALGTMGFSSPVVFRNRVFVLCEPNVLYCINLADGKEFWHKEISASDLPQKLREKVPHAIPDTGNAAATPALTDEHVFVTLANGIVACLDHHGSRIWTHWFGQESELNYGRSASPILCDNKLIVQMHYTFALDPADGKLLWECRDAIASYGTPMPAKVGDENVVVTPRGHIIRASDGKSVAKCAAEGLNSSPVVAGNVSYLLEREISAHRLPKELVEGSTAKALFSDVLDGESFASPLFHDGLLYTINNQGMFRVIDPKSGTVIKEVKLEIKGENEGGYIYGLSLAGRHIFVTGTSGETVVLEPGREARIVAKNSFAPGKGASPFFSGKLVLICTKDKLFCIGM